MWKLLVSVYLVTVYQCYGQYPNRGASQAQDEAALDLSVVKDIANSFGWDLGGQFQLIEESSGPDVDVTVLEYQTNEQNREPSHNHGWKPPHHGHHQTQQLQGTSNGDNNIWYQQIYQSQNGYENPRPPTRPFVEYDNSNYNNYGSQFLNNQNPAIYQGQNFGTNSNKGPWIQYVVNYDPSLANNKFNENRPTDQRPVDTFDLGNQNQFNQNNPWYPNNINQAIESDQQYPNNGGFIAGGQNPINSNPTKPNSPQNGDSVGVEPEVSTLPPPPANPLSIDNKKPEEEEEDFKIDIRFKDDE